MSFTMPPITNLSVPRLLSRVPLFKLMLPPSVNGTNLTTVRFWVRSVSLKLTLPPLPRNQTASSRSNQLAKLLPRLIPLLKINSLLVVFMPSSLLAPVNLVVVTVTFLRERNSNSTLRSLSPTRRTKLRKL